MHRKSLLVVIISGEKVWWVEAQEENEEIFSFPVCFCSVFDFSICLWGFGFFFFLVARMSLCVLTALLKHSLYTTKFTSIKHTTQ